MLRSGAEFAELHGRNTMHKANRSIPKEDFVRVHEGRSGIRTMQGGTKCLLHVQTFSTEYENSDSRDTDVLKGQEEQRVEEYIILFGMGECHSVNNCQR